MRTEPLGRVDRARAVGGLTHVEPLALQGGGDDVDRDCDLELDCDLDRDDDCDRECDRECDRDRDRECDRDCAFESGEGLQEGSSHG